MRLFKNVDICDIESILTLGILPAAELGRDNWDAGRRAANSREVVYLHDSPEGASFTRYGAALVEVETDARVNEMCANDVNRGLYTEYVCDRVPPAAIVAVWVPREIVDKVPCDDPRVKGCGIVAQVFDDAANDYVEAGAEVLQQFFKTAPVVSTEYFNFFRGMNEDRTMIDLKNVKYIREV